MKFSHAAALLILTLFGCAPVANAQSTLLQGGPITPGHSPMYLNSGSSQAVVQDSGPAAGGAVGLGMSEGLYVARGTGVPPYVGQGSGPLGSNWCDYDAPITNATGYHYLCMSPNAHGGGLVAYGAAGGAADLPLNFSINGTTYPFPFAISGILGPVSSIVNDFACWNNTTGSLLKDCGFGTSSIPPSAIAPIGAGTVIANATSGSASPTAVTGTAWFDQAFCNTIGQLVARTVNGWICAPGIPANPVWFGADATGAVSATAAFDATVAAAKYVRFPPGTFTFNTAPATISTVHWIQGSGRDATRLQVNYAGGNFLAFNSVPNYMVSDLSIYSLVDRTGSFITLDAQGSTVQNVYMNRPYTGVYLTSNCFTCHIKDLEVVSATPQVITTGAAGIVVGDVGGGQPESITIDNVLQTSSDGRGRPSYCIKMNSADATILTNINCLQAETAALAVIPTTGSAVLSTMIDHSFFDGSRIGMLMNPSGFGAVARMWMVNVEAGDSDDTGWKIDDSGSNVSWGYTCTQCHFFVNGSYGVHLVNSLVKYVQITDSCFGQNATAGYKQDANVGNISLRNNDFGLCDAFAANAVDAQITAGTSDYLHFSGNKFTSGTTMTVGALTGTHSRIFDNIGYNPVGNFAITVGASPFVYQAGAVPETVYIYGGTVGSEISSGTVVCNPCGAYSSVELGPNENVQVTYTVLPTMGAVRH